MASKTNMNKIIRACYDLNQDWNKELNEKEGELNHCREVAEEYINIKDEEIVELKRELEEEKRRRQEAERGTENFKKPRKELLNLVMDIRRRHRSYQNLLVDHMDKLIICATNLYESIPDIYEDRKFKEYTDDVFESRGGITDLCYKIKRAQQDIKDRPNTPGTVTYSSVTPTRHSVVCISRRPQLLWDIRRKREMGVRYELFGFEDSDSDSD